MEARSREVTLSRSDHHVAQAPIETPVTVATLVQEASEQLSAAGIEEARQEARDLIAAILDAPRFWSLMHAGEDADPELVRLLRRAVSRRAAGAPFAYAAGRSAFRYLSLKVDERVLIPRVETELLPEIVLSLVRSPGGVVADIGTGSGAIALSLASEGNFDRVIATDISAEALEVARENADSLHGALRAPVEFRVGVGIAPVGGERLRAVVSNPPYIAYDELAALPSSVRDWEPAWALSCAREGMAVTAAIIRDAAAVLEPGGVLALEVDVRRAATVAELCATHGAYTGVRVEMDLTGRERFVVARRHGEA